MQVAASPLGRIAISNDAIVQIVGHAAAESYGVVALAGPRPLLAPAAAGDQEGDRRRAARRRARHRPPGRVENGLKLAEVATAVRSRVLYEVERMVGIPVAALEVHIEGVRG